MYRNIIMGYTHMYIYLYLIPISMYAYIFLKYADETKHTYKKKDASLLRKIPDQCCIKC